MKNFIEKLQFRNTPDIDALLGLIQPADNADSINMELKDLEAIVSNGKEVVFLQNSGSNAEAMMKEFFKSFEKEGEIKACAIWFGINPEFPFEDIADVMDIVFENVSEEADVMFGTKTSDKFPLQNVKISILAVFE